MKNIIKIAENDFDYKQGLVSIIVPCYNSGKFLSRLLRSVCMQTYTYIQLIVVNDGSTDETQNVFALYIPTFQRIGIRYTYIEQENQGQAAAINTALPRVEGEYLMWVDSDDFLAENHIEKKVKCFEDHKSASIVCCRGIIVKEDNLEFIAGNLDNGHMIGKLFESLLFERARCTPGLYMVKTTALFNVLTNKKIYPSRVGQNVQLLLPISYKYKTCYINEPLFYYVIRNNSHSHAIHGKTAWDKRFCEIKELKLYVLNEMREVLPEDYICLLRELICLQELYQKIDMILSRSYEECSYNREEIGKLYRCFEKQQQSRQYWLWGFCDKNRKLKQYIEKYTGTKVIGFIDSDKTKCNGTDVISPQDIDVNKMYLIIMLRNHPDITEKLYEYGFQINRDVFYPELEIDERLNEYNMLHKKR